MPRHAAFQRSQVPADVGMRSGRVAQAHEGADDEHTRLDRAGLLKTDATMMAPCSVMAHGGTAENRSRERWSQSVTTSACSAGRLGFDDVTVVAIPNSHGGLRHALHLVCVVTARRGRRKGLAILLKENDRFFDNLA